MSKVLSNPIGGAPIIDFPIKEHGFSGSVSIPVGGEVELPDIAADILSEIYGFLRVSNGKPDVKVEEKKEVIVEEVKKTEVDADIEVSYECGTCGKVCKNKIGLAGHMKSHVKKEEE